MESNPFKKEGVPHGYLTVWQVGAGVTGDVDSVNASAERSVQVEGEFDEAIVVIEGSNDGINYHTINSTAGVRLEFRVTGLEAIAEITRFLRPRVLGGGAATQLTIAVLVRM